jgi:hypothetical protein
MGCGATSTGTAGHHVELTGRPAASRSGSAIGLHEQLLEKRQSGATGDVTRSARAR